MVCSSFQRLRPLASALLLCYLGQACAQAQEPFSVEDMHQLLALSLEDLIAMPVSTASRQSETRDQTPAQIVLFTREQIQQRRYKNLADLLFDLPGVDFQRGTKSSQYNQFAVQGYVGPNKLLVLQDGVRIGHPVGGNFPIAENLSLHHAKQVEVLFGPAAALYGADAVAGVVNIITDSAGPAGTHSVSVGMGRFGSREASFFTGVRLSERLAISAGGHNQRSERAPLDHFYPAYFEKVDAKFGNQTVLPAHEREDYSGAIRSHSLFTRLDFGEQLSVGLLRTHFNSLTSTGDPMATARFDPQAQWQTTNDTLYAHYRFRPHSDVQAQLSLDIGRMQVDPSAYYSNVFNGFKQGYSYVYGKRSAIEHSLNWRINAQHQLQGGLGWQQFRDIEASSLPFAYHPGRANTEQQMHHPNTDLPLVPMQASFHNLSTYVQWQAQWNAQLATTAGLRLDRHSAYGSSANPRLGAVYKPNAQHVFKAMYGQAFRAPSPEESLSAYGTFDGSRDAQGRYVGHNFRIPNLDLKPEKVRTLSASWDWRPSNNLNIGTQIYRSRIDQLIVTKTQPGQHTDAIAGAVLIDPEAKGNAGHQAQHGIDVSVQWRFRLNPDWHADLWGSASWIRGHIDEGDGVDWRIPYVASRKLKLGTTLSWRDRFTITPKIYWSSAVTHSRKKGPTNPLLPPAYCQGNMSAPARCSTPGYTLVDLHLGWHRLLDGKASLWLDITNLLDRRYFAAGGSGSQTFWDVPQQPRHWMLTLDYRF